MKDVFDKLREMSGGKLSQKQVDAANKLLNFDENSVREMLVMVGKKMKMTSGGFNILRNHFGKLNQKQVDNINLVVEFCNKHFLEYNQAAYVLATAWHETNQTMLPVIEAYWLSEDWRKKNLRYYPWYGRGYVQLTWEYNYRKADQKLGLNGAMLKDPSLAQVPKYAAEILVLGSKEGWFTGKKLSDYIGRVNKDYKQARRIINGMDKAQKIANEAVIFEKALRSW